MRDSQQVLTFSSCLKKFFFKSSPSIGLNNKSPISILTATYWLVSSISQREPKALLNVAKKEKDPFASINQSFGSERAPHRKSSALDLNTRPGLVMSRLLSPPLPSTET